MPYCTQADIEAALGGSARLVKLADFDGDGEADAAVVAAAIAYADGIINTYLAPKYTVPVTDAAALAALAPHAANLAVYKLNRNRGFKAEEEKADHDASIRFLRDLASGLGTLGNTSAPAAQAADNGVESTHSAASDFRDSLDGF
jgi:phage gp36-like protein